MTDNELFAGIVLIPFGAAAGGRLCPCTGRIRRRDIAVLDRRALGSNHVGYQTACQGFSGGNRGLT